MDGLICMNELACPECQRQDFAGDCDPDGNNPILAFSC